MVGCGASAEGERALLPAVPLPRVMGLRMADASCRGSKAWGYWLQAVAGPCRSLTAVSGSRRSAEGQKKSRDCITWAAAFAINRRADLPLPHNDATTACMRHRLACRSRQAVAGAAHRQQHAQQHVQAIWRGELWAAPCTACAPTCPPCRSSVGEKAIEKGQATKASCGQGTSRM